MSDFDLRLEVV